MNDFKFTPPINKLTCKSADPLKLNLHQKFYQHKLGLLKNGTFQPCSASLTPWVLPHDTFKHAVNTARALSQLFFNVSQHHQFLENALADFKVPTSLLAQLAKTLERQPRARALNLSRQDLLADKNGDWRLVESNSIAAGMGPFCESLNHLLDSDKLFAQKKWENTTGFIDNPATQSLALTLFQNAQLIHGTGEPLIIFVVQADEDNIYDQLKLSRALQHLGARVIRRTFAELSGELKSFNNALIHPQLGRIDAIYLRTGYNLADYLDEQSAKRFLNFRHWLEQHDLLVAPSISHQLATSKWVQMKLSQLEPSTRAQLFKLSTQQSHLVSDALNVKYKLPQHYNEAAFYLNSGQWILKSQNEGGGNVIDNPKHLTRDIQMDEYLLMERIDAAQRQTSTCVFQQGDIRCFTKVTSELGVFTLGDKHEYGGYLLRSKPAEQLEVGVHQAGGFLDTIRLAQSASSFSTV